MAVFSVYVDIYLDGSSLTLNITEFATNKACYVPYLAVVDINYCWYHNMC